MPSQRALNKASHAFKKLLNTQGPDAAQAVLDRRGGQLPPQLQQRGRDMINEARMNKGGPVGYNYGGSVVHPMSEEEKRKRMMQQQPRIAQSQVPNAPLSPQKQAVAPGRAGGGGGVLGQIGMQLGKKALTSMLGPLGMFLNTGGSVPNRYGYNEGGPAATGGVPIKKVMDMDKLSAQRSMENIKEDQAERSFQMAEKRKQEMHQLQMQQKKESHEQQMKLKKESATMKGPLSGGK